MQRHTAKLEGRDASSTEWFKEIFQPFKERVHLRQGVEIVGDHFRHVVNDVFGDPLVGDQDIDNGGLSDIFYNSPERAFLNRHLAIERDVSQNLLQLTRRVRNDSDVRPLAQIRHDPVRNRRLELRIDIARDQGTRTLVEAHMNRCKAIKGDSENAKNSMDVLLHTAAFGADDDALVYEIGDGPDLGMR